MEVLLSIIAHPYLLIGCIIAGTPFYLAIYKAFFKGSSYFTSGIAPTNADYADDSTLTFIFFVFLCAGIATMFYKLAEHVFY